MFDITALPNLLPVGNDGTCLSAGMSQAQFTTDQALNLLWSEIIRYINSVMLMIQSKHYSIVR